MAAPQHPPQTRMRPMPSRLRIQAPGRVDEAAPRISDGETACAPPLRAPPAGEPKGDAEARRGLDERRRRGQST